MNKLIINLLMNNKSFCWYTNLSSIH